LAAALAFFAAQVAAAAAQTYPSRPVTMIVPYPAGGPTDTLARILSDHMKSSLGQSVIIENIAGGGGSLGASRAPRPTATRSASVTGTRTWCTAPP